MRPKGMGMVGYETYKEFLELMVRRLADAFGDDGLLGCCLFGSVARGEAVRARDGAGRVVALIARLADTIRRPGT